MGGSKYASESALLHTFPKCQEKKEGTETFTGLLLLSWKNRPGSASLACSDGKHKSVSCERLCFLASSSPVTARAADTRLCPVSR